MTGLMLLNCCRRREKSGMWSVLICKATPPPTRSMASHFCHSPVGPALRPGDVGMHDGVRDEAEAGWRGIMKLRDWGDRAGRMQWAGAQRPGLFY